MNTFQLKLGTLVSYNGLAEHETGKVIGIDSYSKIENSNVVKTWVSYSITSSPELDVNEQMTSGARWWLTWDGSTLREWIYATEENVDLSGQTIEAVTGDIAVTFEGDAGVSTSNGQLFVCQGKTYPDVWHAKETFYTASGDKEIICFFAQPISQADLLTITTVA
ncbi:MAG: hypothetical protein AB8B99_08235 [Phormidesmis sp.]